MAFHLLAGQCTFGFLQLLPQDERAWLLFVPALFLVRGGAWLAFAVGGLWQLLWTRDSGGEAHPFFWFLASAQSEKDPLPIFFHQGRLDQLAGALGVELQSFFLNWDPEWGRWYLRFAFGFQDGGHDAWPRIYEELGLLHVLVVSGAHFSLIGAFLQRLLEGPGRVAYALRLLPFSAWLGWVTLARMLLTLLITVFALVVGFNPPCQRAWLALLVSLWLPLLGAPFDERRCDRLVFSLQALGFPGSFLSLSNALSWSAYTLVRYLRPWPEAWQRRLLPAAEGPLIAVNVGYFGSFSPWGLLLNPFLQAVWHFILGAGLLYWLWPEAWIGEGLRLFLQGLHEGILYVHQLGQPVRWDGQGPLGVWVRSLLWCAGSWTFFRLWRSREGACGKEPSPVT